MAGGRKADPETCIGGANLVTPHAPAAYPGLLVVEAAPTWPRLVCLQDGETVVGRGGERLVPYVTADGARADGFELAPGDEATRVRSGLGHQFSEWRIARRAPGQPLPSPGGSPPREPPPADPGALSCRDFVQFLVDYLEHSLVSAERDRFELHLALCPACVAYLESYRRTVLLTRTLAEPAGEASLTDGIPEDLVQAILAAQRGA